jgi:hypothetical protein
MRDARTPPALEDARDWSRFNQEWIAQSEQNEMMAAFSMLADMFQPVNKKQLFA